MNISNVVPTADENRPKSAVVMYCIKAVDEYINPAQVDMAKVAEAVALKADRDEVKELAGTRLWVSGEYKPILSTPTTVLHGLNIDPLKCKCDVLLKCIVADGGYTAGDIISGFAQKGSTGDIETPSALLLSTNQIRTTTASGILRAIRKDNGGFFNIVQANWRYVFRIWY